jgi:hypothetical protein
MPGRRHENPEDYSLESGPIALQIAMGAPDFRGRERSRCRYIVRRSRKVNVGQAPRTLTILTSLPQDARIVVQTPTDIFDDDRAELLTFGGKTAFVRDGR